MFFHEINIAAMENKDLESICFIECESCEIPTNVETMHQDDDSNWFCEECWKELSPVMKKEYEDLKAKGEID